MRRMPQLWPWVVLRWLEARVGGECVYGDRGAHMRGVEVVVVAACVVGDENVWHLYVVVEHGAEELVGDARCRVSCFGCGVVRHEDVNSPLIVSGEVVVR